MGSAPVLVARVELTVKLPECEAKVPWLADLMHVPESTRTECGSQNHDDVPKADNHVRTQARRFRILKRLITNTYALENIPQPDGQRTVSDSQTYSEREHGLEVMGLAIEADLEVLWIAGRDDNEQRRTSRANIISRITSPPLPAQSPSGTISDHRGKQPFPHFPALNSAISK